MIGGIPDQNGSEAVGPTDKQWVVGAKRVSGWVGVPSPEDPSRWVYFWLAGATGSASYRCYPESSEPTSWRALRSPAEVFAITGYAEEEEEPDEPGAELGSAEILEPDTYKLDFLCHHDGEAGPLEGIRFEVPATEPPW